MKNLLKVAAVALCMVFMGNFAKAQTQTKIGYIAVDQILQVLPDVKTVQTQVDTYSQQFVAQLQTLQKEFDGKLADYNAKKATMTDAARTAAESDLQDLQNRSTTMRDKASQQVEAKGQELMKPVLEKIKTAVSTVAKEKGYTYVINTSQTDLIVAPPADDLLAPVKLKLNLK